MAKLTKSQRRQIERALYNADRAAAYLLQESTVVASRRSMATTTLDYVRPGDGKVMCEVAKEYGSNLTGLWDCQRILRDLLNPATE
jgi:hypothetical protein